MSKDNKKNKSNKSGPKPKGTKVGNLRKSKGKKVASSRVSRRNPKPSRARS